MGVDLIVFDLDGTLVDSSRDLADATNAMLVGYGAPPLPTAAVTAMVGEGAAVLVRRALTAAGLDPDTPGALDRFLACYDDRLLVHTRPYDGMVETLATLKRASRLAVLTNKPTFPTTKILAGLDLAKYFDLVVGGDTEHGRKPSPNGLLALIDAAAASPRSTAFVGDSRVDLETARRAGVRMYLASYGFGFTLTDDEIGSEDVTIDHPLDLTRALQFD